MLLPHVCFLKCIHMVSYSSGPQPFWHQGPVSWKTIFPWMGWWGDSFGMIQVHYSYCALYFYYYYTVIYYEIIIQLTIMLTRGRAQVLMQWWGAAVNTDEASLAHPLFTSCCAARFLTGHGPVPVGGLGAGDPLMLYILFYSFLLLLLPLLLFLLFLPLLLPFLLLLLLKTLLLWELAHA